MEPPRDLTIPDPGSTTARAILSAAIGRLLREVGPLLRGALAFRAPPGALASALRRPTAGALVRCVRNEAFPDREARIVELAATLAFELALAGALPAPVRLRRAPTRLLSIPAGIALSLPEDTRGIALENGRLRVERAAGFVDIDLDRAPDAAHAYHRIDGEIVLALADNNPLSAVEAHPDKAGNAIDLGGREPGEWTAALRGALEIIARYLPDIRAEMELFVQQVVPVGWDAERHLSASYQEAIGTIYLSLHPNEMTLAEALIHEFSHTKLNALFELDAVLENAWSPLYRSPVRPDPRPLHGVLLAVHAFLPVARLYEQMIAAGDPRAESASFRARFAAIRRINHEGAELVLAEARPTPIGRGLIEEIGRWDAHYSALPGG